MPSASPAIRLRPLLALVPILLAVAPATAQTTPTRTPEEIVRALGVATPAATAPAPAAAEDEDDSMTVGPQKAFSLATPGRKAAAPSVTTRVPGTMVASRAAPARTAATAPRRTSSAAPSPLDMRVTFDLGSADMTEQAKAEARVFAQALQAPALAGTRFEVAGHTDAQGDRAFNLDLSRRRAQSVVDFLVAQGADGSRLVANGYGFDKPLPGANPASPNNRRVEFSRAN